MEVVISFPGNVVKQTENWTSEKYTKQIGNFVLNLLPANETNSTGCYIIGVTVCHENKNPPSSFR